MQCKAKSIAGIILVILMSFFRMTAQISPGDLSNPHSHLEGISNCTQCHVLGNKVSSEKCLVCHTEIKERITLQKGYHASADVNGKECFACHSDHHGKNFQLIRLDITKFDHSLTGYNLSGPHSKKQCIDCHNLKFIADQKIKTRKNTYLGVNFSVAQEIIARKKNSAAKSDAKSIEKGVKEIPALPVSIDTAKI